ncbi:MAG: hypothetical protein E7198_11215 [Schwartzia succinivorans]|uniref:hypothetical protein n=1 Tax=Schwartzia succinivorans TaxID=55507 RepID=UPI0023524E06|nr:hypothetical protein [Schwartzia succinivorans]MBE6098332.1 hypothetical protein [Schwartzia succinivorans]
MGFLDTVWEGVKKQNAEMLKYKEQVERMSNVQLCTYLRNHSAHGWRWAVLVTEGKNRGFTKDDIMNS